MILWRHMTVCPECDKTEAMENPVERKKYMHRWPVFSSQSTQCSYDGRCGSRKVIEGWLPVGYLPIREDDEISEIQN